MLLFSVNSVSGLKSSINEMVSGVGVFGLPGAIVFVSLLLLLALLLLAASNDFVDDADEADDDDFTFLLLPPFKSKLHKPNLYAISLKNKK